MKKESIKYSVVDAFTESPFKGNPAVVFLLDEERDDEWLQEVAIEFHMPVTCYLTRLPDHDSEIQNSSESTRNPRFRLRWFTIIKEVPLCGHATVAAAHFLFTSGLVSADKVELSTLSGVVTAKRVFGAFKSDPLTSQINGEAKGSFFIELDFPIESTFELNPADLPLVYKALNGTSAVEIRRTAKGDDLLVVFPSAKEVIDFQPQFDDIKNCPGRGVLVTGAAPPESGFDFVSRFFAPKLGYNEDHVCGSAHCSLTPYWSKKLGKSDFVAYQASRRGGILNLHLDEKRERLLIRGKAVVVMEGSLLL